MDDKLNLDIGIERIRFENALTSAVEKLPGSPEVDPAGTQRVDNIRAMYDRPGVLEMLRDLITPHIEDPSLLASPRLKNALQDAFERVSDMADNGDTAAQSLMRVIKPLQETDEHFWTQITALTQA